MAMMLILFHVSQSQATYYEIQELPCHVSNNFPVQPYRNYRTCPKNIHINSPSSSLINYRNYYDKNNYCYNPYDSVYSRFSRNVLSQSQYNPNFYQQNLFEQQYSSPFPKINYYLKPSYQYPQKYIRNIHYVNVPINKDNTKIHRNYFSSFDPYKIYQSSFISSQKLNNSNIDNDRNLLPSTFTLTDSMLNPALYVQNANKPSYFYVTSTKAPFCTSTKTSLICSENKNAPNKNNIQFMFPSEIVIRSLGPWAVMGDDGEYRSNGTFSIKYDISKPIDCTNKSEAEMKKLNLIKYPLKLINKVKETDNPATNGSSDTSQRTDTLNKLMKETSQYDENIRIKPFDEDSLDDIKENKSNRQDFNEIKKKKLRKRHKNGNNRYEEKASYKPQIKKSLQRELNDRFGEGHFRLTNQSFRRKNIPRLSDSSKNNLRCPNYFDNNIIKTDKRLKRRRRQRRPGLKARKRAFVSSDFSCSRNPRTTVNLCTKQSSCEQESLTTSSSIINTDVTEESESVSANPNQTPIPKDSMRQSTTKLPNVTADNMGNPFKSQCEQTNRVRCVCSMRKALEEMDKIIASQTESKELFQSLSDYTCSTYFPVKNAFKISADMKPRLISNKHKELLVDEGVGPKEITGETLAELMERGAPNEGIDFYVFPSTNIEVPCITTNKIQLSPNTADSTKYTWSHANKKVITEGRITEDLNHRGSLQINGVTMDDSDNYTCIVNYISPDTESPTNNSFLHTIFVVSEPLLSLHTLIHYTSKANCDQEILEMFELYLPQQIEQIICENDEINKLCNVEIHNPMCHTNRQQKSPKSVESKSVYEVPRRRGNDIQNIDSEEEGMEMSLNYEVDIGNIWQLLPSTNNKTYCNPFCQQKVLLKIIEILRESFDDVLVYPIQSSNGESFLPDLSTINVKIIIACGGGLKLSQGFCVPCPREHYSEEGSTQCSKCPPGTYQDKIGAKICEKCPHPFKPGCFEMWYSPVALTILTGVIIIIVLFCCLLMYCCSPKGGRSCAILTCHCCARQNTRKNGPKIRKSKKQSKKHQKSGHIIEEPPTPPTEDFSA